MSTSTALRDPIPGLALSNVLRASVAALAKNLSIELGPRGIRVNHVMPGRIATDRMRQVDQIQADQLGVTVDEVRTDTVSRVPLGRYGTPDEFGRLAALLLSDSASYLSGVSIQVDGGLLRSVF